MFNKFKRQSADESQNKIQSKRKGKKQNRNRKSSSASLGFEKLEKRELLASFLSDVGVLTVVGTSGVDTIRVQQVGMPFYQVRVFVNNLPPDIYSSGQVQSVKTFALGGNDTVYHNTFKQSEIFGAGGNDKIYGGTSVDRIYGGGGIDTIHGNGGNDFLNGQSGNDIIYGGGGADIIYGIGGHDRLDGGEGNDRLVGGLGNDHLTGQAGDDVLFGNAGTNTLSGGDGNDEAYGESGSDTIYGGAGDDRLYGYGGVDTIRGDAGDDIINGHGSGDTLQGGDGRDQIFGGDGADNIHAGNGDDIIRGGRGGDTIVGFQGSNTIYGEGGQDTITGGTDRDTIFGGDDRDTILGGAGNDKIEGGNGNDIIRAGDGDDEIEGGEGHDNLYGDNGNDLLEGNNGRDTLSGGNGNDVVYGGVDRSRDFLTGNAGMDQFLTEDMSVQDWARDVTRADAYVLLRNGNQGWSDREVMDVSETMDRIRDDLGTYNLFREPNDTAARSPLNLINDSSTGLGSNQLVNGRHLIRLSDAALSGSWLSSDGLRPGQVLVHELGHTWQGANTGAWNNFIAASGWTQQNQTSNPSYTLSGDRRWFYLSNSEFATIRESDQRGRFNPYEDWATMWEEYFYVSTSGTGELGNKLRILDNLFAAIA